MERMLGQLLYITHNKEYIEYVVVYSLSSSVLLKDETVIWTHQTFFYDLPSIFLLAKRRLISRWFSSVILIMLLFLQRELYSVQCTSPYNKRLLSNFARSQGKLAHLCCPCYYLRYSLSRDRA